MFGLFSFINLSNCSSLWGGSRVGLWLTREKIKGTFLLPGKEPDFNTCKLLTHVTSGKAFVILRLVPYHGAKRQNECVVFWRLVKGTVA